MQGKEVILLDNFNKVLKKTISTPGDYSNFVVEGCKCELKIENVSFKYQNGDDGIDRKSFYFSEGFNGVCTIGDCSYYLDLDVERCLQHMNAGETSHLTIVYRNGDDEVALEVNFDATLCKISEAVLFCEWELSRKISAAKQLKDSGVALIKESRTLDAFRQFSKALRFILTIGGDDLQSLTGDDKTNLELEKVKLYNNLAHCQLQFDEYAAAIVLCSKALDIENDNVKALYRRGVAYMGLEDWENAKEDIMQVLTLDPSVAEAKQKISIINEKVKHLNEAYKQTIKNMFN